ncbi:unnamed protein product, partial [Amoebophrya sp. A25]
SPGGSLADLTRVNQSSTQLHHLSPFTSRGASLEGFCAPGRTGAGRVGQDQDNLPIFENSIGSSNIRGVPESRDFLDSSPLVRCGDSTSEFHTSGLGGAGGAKAVKYGAPSPTVCEDTTRNDDESGDHITATGGETRIISTTARASDGGAASADASASGSLLNTQPLLQRGREDLSRGNTSGHTTSPPRT